jgi:aryl-alcohol dehydrogenase-like predicted oxidoreductase
MTHFDYRVFIHRQLPRTLHPIASSATHCKETFMPNLTLDTYRLLGRSGLRVSPLALGTMTFGSDWGWGSDIDEAQRIFDSYVDRGGNFIDTANLYTNGTSETLLGKFARDKRERLILATKYTLTTRPGDPNSGGNHRRSMVRSVEDSLVRLQTDYIDLLYLHVWDSTTHPEEILRGLDDLVRAGKIIYAGISDTPAWQVARMQAIADLRGWSPLVALQIEYSLIERTVERDLIPMAREMGLGVIPWSPLGGGVLTGKYTAEDLETGGGQTGAVGTRKNVAVANGSLSARGLAIANEVKLVAAQIEKSPSQVALAWILLNRAVTSPIIGARTLRQLHDNLGALDVQLAPEHVQRLNAASAIELGFPHDFVSRALTMNVIFGEVKIQPR